MIDTYYSDILIYRLFYLARLMVPRKQGLIVNISSVGGMRYLFNVAYGVGKVKLESFLSLFSYFSTKSRQNYI
jgi:NAD(P)-dependent dehydrogenase (short-subunit alcohol dehydrogenase family)